LGRKNPLIAVVVVVAAVVLVEERFVEGIGDVVAAVDEDCELAAFVVGIAGKERIELVGAVVVAAGGAMGKMSKERNSSAALVEEVEEVVGLLPA
jgi:hypothetical protein